MLLSVSNFESGKTVQIRIYNVTISTEVVAWTATGVSERADGQGYSIYYYNYAIVSGSEYIVDWKDNSSPVVTASEGISAKQTGGALEATSQTMLTETQSHPTLAEIEASTILAKEATAQSILTDTAEIGAAGAGLTALATQASVNTIDDLLDTEITAIINAIAALQTDLGDPSVDATTLYAQLTLVKGYVDDLETRLTATRAGYLDNLSAGAAALEVTMQAILTDTGTTLDTKLNNIQGATFDTATDSLEALRNRGDAAWITATGFSTHSAADIWAVATRVLTAGTNIALAKGTGVTGFNDLDAAAVNAEVDTALADINLDHLVGTATGIPAIPAGTFLDQIMDDGTAVYDRTTDSLQAIADGIGGGLTQQQVRDAMKLAPTGGAPSAGSVDEHLDDILTDTAVIGVAGAGLTSLATQASVTAIDDLLDTEVAAIKAKTDLIPAVPAAVGDIPTATQNADALLNRDMSAVSDTNARSPLNALRFIRNKWAVVAGTLTVRKEDDTTSAWTSAVSTDAAADPIVGNDPA